MHPDVADLLTLVPLDHPGGERFDWEAVAAALGTRLPADYVSFMDTYGVGDIGNMVILPPVPIHGPSYHIAGSCEIQRTLWREDGLTARPEDILPWGSGCNANELAWLMTGSDPDAWPVVAWRRHGYPYWARFDCGMVRFVTRLLRAEFDECPLSDASLWGRPLPFVSWREQRRRMVAGLDRLTAEPDPYAEMFPIYE